MMASRKSEEGVSRPKQKKTKQIGMKHLLIAGVGIVLVVVLALLLFGGGGGRKKPTTARRARTDSLSESVSIRKPKRSTARRAARVTEAKRDEERARRRAERLQRKEETRVSGKRTSRSSRGGYSSGSGTRVTSSPNELRAIIDDGTGSRTALVGERRLRAGDDIEGRRIVEVSGDGVKVEYRQSTYMVKVGQKVY
jgi:sRNA-binding protein